VHITMNLNYESTIIPAINNSNNVILMDNQRTEDVATLATYQTRNDASVVSNDVYWKARHDDVLARIEREKTYLKILDQYLRDTNDSCLRARNAHELVDLSPLLTITTKVSSTQTYAAILEQYLSESKNSYTTASDAKTLEENTIRPSDLPKVDKTPTYDLILENYLCASQRTYWIACRAVRTLQHAQHLEKTSWISGLNSTQSDSPCVDWDRRYSTILEQYIEDSTNIYLVARESQRRKQHTSRLNIRYVDTRVDNQTSLLEQCLEKLTMF